MASGRIIRFNQANGYGFIEPDDGGEDVFVHINDVCDPVQVLRPGMRVAYSVELGSRGRRASRGATGIRPLMLRRRAA